MVAMMESFQRYYLPIFAIGLVTGLLALIPAIGWLLGISVFVLANKYTHRNSVFADLMVMVVMWVVIRQLAMQLTLS